MNGGVVFNFIRKQSFRRDLIVNLSGKVLDEGSKRYLEGYLSELPFYLVTDKKVQLYGAAALCIEPNLIRN